MPSRSVPLINGHYYHIYNRTVGFKKLFYSHDDYVYYTDLLKEIDFSPCCDLIAYCLMPNHYHYLVRITDKNLFPKKMSFFFSKYLYSLQQHQIESGRYFVNRYQNKLITDESYLIHLCCYIHLNSVKAGLVDSVEAWPYSNYYAFVGKTKDQIWSSEFWSEYIQSSANYRELLHMHDFEESIQPFFFSEEHQK